MAVFYFSTDGPNWIQCSAPDDLSDPASVAAANANCNLEVEIGEGGTDAWLTAVSECNWGGVACKSDGSGLDRIDMDRIEFGKLLTMCGMYYLKCSRSISPACVQELILPISTLPCHDTFQRKTI